MKDKPVAKVTVTRLKKGGFTLRGWVHSPIPVPLLHRFAGDCTKLLHDLVQVTKVKL